MVERNVPIVIFSRFALAIIVFVTAACTSTGGDRGPAPVDDVSIGAPSSQVPSGTSGARAVPGDPSYPSSGGAISSEALRSDDLMESSGDLSEPGIPAPIDGQRNLALANQSQVISSLLQSADAASTEQRWEEAASVLERALRIEPSNGLLWQRLAEVRFAQGDYLQSVQLASKSDALAGTDSTLRRDNLILMIESYDAMGDFQQADALRQNASERVSRTSR